MSVQPFEVRISDAVLADLGERLASTQLPDASQDERGESWDSGTSPAFLRRLLERWKNGFDWRAQEATINRFAQFRAPVGGLELHFIHERGRGKTPLPLILTHGYPDSFLRFSKLIPLLTDPGTHGGDPSDAFDVVAPSLPGFGFSQQPASDGMTFQVGNLWHELMTEQLGYARFGAHGGDWGSTITEHLARSHAASLVGIHLTDVPFWHTFQKPKDLSPAEERRLAATSAFMTKQGAYAMIQGTRPLTLAQGLNDSPAGLAAWLVEKFQSLSDCHGDVETRFSLDELLTNVMIYWTTGTIGSAFLPYYDFTQAGAMRWILETAKGWVGHSHVPAGIALFAKDSTHAPREWAQRFFNVQRYTEFPRGGHFAAFEEPELLAEDLRAFFRPLRATV
jgi:pimeloyl-ACP methyl ester carboxylesterase